MFLERTPTCTKVVAEIFALSLVSLLYAANVAIGVFSWWGDHEALGLDKSLKDGLHRYRTVVSPATWTYTIWLGIYLAQGMWILYAWSFCARQKKPRTIFPGVYPAYMLVCGLNIGWVYSVCNLHPELSLALIALLSLVLIVTIAMSSLYLFKITLELKFFLKHDLRITRVLFLNSLVMYAAWAVITTLLSLGHFLQEDADVHVDTTATVILSLIASISIAYFLLENTILDRFLRYVIAAYPVVIWTLAGMIADRWDSMRDDTTERNNLIILSLSSVAVILFVLRLVLLIVFFFQRRIDEYDEGWEETVPM